ncbi:hypothetical protein BaRGS_00039371 [Batillaria attramentaria]|uniref:Xylose isomerase-like TIM barrel domain-containing protein n=1 Tax=Batillaria attramentaria TaxID=370345 RepID=A0ABD0J3F5_9CAEN
MPRVASHVRTTKMAEEVKTYLRKLMNTVEGLHAILISDRDGVPMLKVADQNAPELALRPTYLSTFSHMADQASKVGMGANQAIISFYDNLQVVQLNRYPLMVTFIADADSNTVPPEFWLSDVPSTSPAKFLLPEYRIARGGTAWQDVIDELGDSKSTMGRVKKGKVATSLAPTAGRGNNVGESTYEGGATKSNVEGKGGCDSKLTAGSEPQNLTANQKRGKAEGRGSRNRTSPPQPSSLNQEKRSLPVASEDGEKHEITASAAKRGHVTRRRLKDTLTLKTAGDEQEKPGRKRKASPDTGDGDLDTKRSKLSTKTPATKKAQKRQVHAASTVKDTMTREIAEDEQGKPGRKRKASPDTGDGDLDTKRSILSTKTPATKKAQERQVHAASTVKDTMTREIAEDEQGKPGTKRKVSPEAKSKDIATKRSKAMVERKRVDVPVKGGAAKLKKEPSGDEGPATKQPRKRKMHAASKATDAEKNVNSQSEPSKGQAKVKEENSADKTLPASKLSTSTRTSSKMIGAHCSIAGGLENAVREAVELGGRAIGMFLKSQRTWNAKPLDPEAAAKFKAACKEHGFPPNSILPHGSYLLNCGSPNPETLKKSRDALLDELQRCEALGLTLFNFHPGSTCGEITVDECLDKIADCINWAHSQTKFVITVVENMSCQGNTVGGHFEELHGIIDRVKDKSRIGICLDTCHAFAAGFDLATEEGYKQFVEDFDKIVGLEYLKAMHLNDSKGAVGCHLDRHENIGKGHIGLDGFRRLMTDPRFDGIPMILETPTGAYDVEIKTLYKMTK